MDDFKYFDDDELQAEIDRRKAAQELQEGLVLVNRGDIESGMWNATWEVCFDPVWHGAIAYRAAADCESDALDEVIDWLEANDPATLATVVLLDEDFLNLSDHMQENIEYAGNHGHPLHPEIEISVTLVKTHRYMYGYY